MSEPSQAVQKALFEALGALSCEVYDYVPQGAAYPYVVIDSMVAMNDDPLASRREVRMVYLSIWSQYKGQKEVLGIHAQIDTLLHNKKLPLETGRMVMCRVIDKKSDREPDGLTFQGRVKLRVITEF